MNLVLGGLSHWWPDDIDMLLVGPGGQNAKIWSDAGGSLDVVAASAIVRRLIEITGLHDLLGTTAP